MREHIRSRAGRPEGCRGAARRGRAETGLGRAALRLEPSAGGSATPAPGRLLALLVALATAAAMLAAAPPAGASHQVATERVAGADRFATAAAVSLATFPDGADVAVVARADAFADALAAAPLARRLGGPILLTATSVLPGSTVAELARLGAAEVVLLGGTAAISQAVEEQVAAAVPSVRRITGSDRFATAAAVARAIDAAPGGIGVVEGRRTAFLASGLAYPDALAAAGPAAARENPTPILLTPRDELAPAAAAALADLEVEEVLLVGGEAAVGAAVARDLAARGMAVRRLAGPNRLATAVAIAEHAFGAFGLRPDRAVLARGDAFPDALAAGPHAGMAGAPILLTATPSILGPETGAWFRDACLEVGTVRAVGGTAAVSASVLAEAAATAHGCHGTWGSIPPAPVPGRVLHSGTWSGDRLLVWGGADAAPTGPDVVHADGAAWNPTTRGWRALPPAPIAPRWAHAAVWTGDRLLVWGGAEGPDHLADCYGDGALYDPVSGTWEPIPTSPVGGRCGAAVVWTGTELIHHGGVPGGAPQPPRQDGAAYNPSTGTWRALPPAPVPARTGHVGVWTGEELVVFGGLGPQLGEHRNDGAAYDPATDSWRSIPAAPLPPRAGVAGAWTGAELVVLGGAIGPQQRVDGAAYDPAANTWRRIADSPPDLGTPELVWGADRLYAVGGVDDPASPGAPTAAAAYDPAADSWQVLPAPPQGARGQHAAAWAGDRLLVWGGIAGGGAAGGVVYRP